ncbi:MAG TPA: hypothetical protein PKI03_19190 [Pseudomonadota bacterium]|nr:hypothetical protein [Pseudomonadota bacterium]
MTILHWDGTKQIVSPEALMGAAELTDVSGVSRTDMWAVGEAGALLHRDAVGWRNLRSGPTATIYSAWAASASDIWAVAAGGTLLHWDGSAWRTVQGPVGSEWLAISGSSASDVWAVGSGGGAMHWNGTTWSMQPVQTVADLRALYVAPGGASVFAAGTAGNVYRYVGSWQKLTTNITVGLNAIWGTGADDIWAAGVGGTVIHWNGTVWSTTPSGTTQELTAIGGSAVSNLWFVGANGTALFWDGVMLRSRSTGLSGTMRSVFSNGTVIYAVGDGGALYRANSGMFSTWMPVSSGTSNTLRAIVQRPQPMGLELLLLGDSGTILLYKS